MRNFCLIALLALFVTMPAAAQQDIRPGLRAEAEVSGVVQRDKTQDLYAEGFLIANWPHQPVGWFHRGKITADQLEYATGLALIANAPNTRFELGFGAGVQIEYNSKDTTSAQYYQGDSCKQRDRGENQFCFNRPKYMATGYLFYEMPTATIEAEGALVRLPEWNEFYSNAYRAEASYDAKMLFAASGTSTEGVMIGAKAETLFGIGGILQLNLKNTEIYGAASTKALAGGIKVKF